jgi:hypothetical protein
MSKTKSSKSKSENTLKREIRALRSTLNRVWATLVDIDEATPVEEVLDAIDEACEIMAADWPNDFEITDEVSSNVQQQIDLEDQLNKLVEEAQQTDDWSARAVLFRRSLALGGDLTDEHIEQQIQQLTPDDYRDLALRYLWLMGAVTAPTPIDYKDQADRLIRTLKEFKKSLPRKHGPEPSPVISEALRIRDTENKSYKEIYYRLIPMFGEAMRNLTPITLSARVRSRRSRLRRSKNSNSVVN